MSVTTAKAASFPASTADLGPAGYAIVPAGVVYQVQDDGDEPASLLDLRVDRVLGSTPDVEPAQDATGVVAVGLGNVHVVASANGEAVLSFGWATLAPGARLAWAAGAGPVLLCVETGTLRLDADPNTPWLPDGTTVPAGSSGDGELEADPGVLVPADHAVALSAGTNAPATLLIVTLLPADAVMEVARPSS